VGLQEDSDDERLRAWLENKLFKEMQRELEEKHKGEWVLFQGGRLVQFYKTREELDKAISKETDMLFTLVRREKNKLCFLKLWRSIDSEPILLRVKTNVVFPDSTVQRDFLVDTGASVCALPYEDVRKFPYVEGVDMAYRDGREEEIPMYAGTLKFAGRRFSSVAMIASRKPILGVMSLNSFVSF